MPRLIVNADDFGWTAGINRGIAEAHADGIVTRASLMALAPFAPDAAQHARRLPDLALGLHVALPDGLDPARARAEIDRQLSRFTDLVGRPPTHLDSHHHVHEDPRVTGAFLAAAQQAGIPLRGHNPARYVGAFYAQRDGTSSPEAVTVEALLALLDGQQPAEAIELGCHPGRVDPGLASSYRTEREWELRTLCAPELPAALAARGLELACS